MSGGIDVLCESASNNKNVCVCVCACVQRFVALNSKKNIQHEGIEAKETKK